ncbi:hypothetical protein AMK58_28255 (plasmid) [Azospirillum brasilense]|nr:hypothetical protein AMK58_28255 [Azospirillum brasilense]
MSGSASFAMRMKEWQDTSIASEKSHLGAVDHTHMQIFLRREGDGVQKEIQPAPAVPNSLEHALQIAIPTHVTEQDEAGAEPLSKWVHVRLGLFVQVGNLEVRTELSKRHGTAGGDALVVGDSGHETAFAVEREFCVKGFVYTG